jgi:multidrug efflux pump subunit AcrA (membrane-fusion protein)
MRTESEKSKLRWFIISLVVVALVINSLCFEAVSSSRRAGQQRQQQAQQAQAQLQQQQQQAEVQLQQQQQIEMEKKAAALKAAQDAADAQAKFVARYVNSGFSKTPGSESLAIVVVQNGKLDQTIAAALADHFKSDSIKVPTSFFKPAFVSDNLFGSLFDGSTEVLDKLILKNYLDGLVLAREAVQYTKNSTSLDNVLTANMTLEIQLVPVSSNIQKESWKFTATGAGFSQTEAESMAEERLIKQISNDTKMSLNN